MPSRSPGLAGYGASGATDALERHTAHRRGSGHSLRTALHPLVLLFKKKKKMKSQCGGKKKLFELGHAATIIYFYFLKKKKKKLE